MSVTLADLPSWLVLGLAVLLGLVLGSFTNVVIYRLPRAESLLWPGSRCPACGRPIPPLQNLPVVSWLVLRGRAHCCGARISARYPLVELTGGILAWAVLELLVRALPGQTPWHAALFEFLLSLGLGLGLIAVAWIDIEHMLVPDEITVGGSLLALLTAPWRTDALGSLNLGCSVLSHLGMGSGSLACAWLESALGMGFGYVLIWLPFEVAYARLRGQPGMGRGDAKLVMLAGAWFGWDGALFALLGGSVQGTLVALALYAAQGRIEEPEAVRAQRDEIRKKLELAQGEERRALEKEMAKDPLFRDPEPGLGKARISFGPFLALAILEYLLVARPLIALYLELVTI